MHATQENASLRGKYATSNRLRHTPRHRAVSPHPSSPSIANKLIRSPPPPAANRICPIFLLSNVTGSGLDNLRGLLNCLPSSEGGKKYVTDAPLEFSISDVFSVPFAGSVAVSWVSFGVGKLEMRS